MYCTNCGNELADTEVVCGKCGHQISGQDDSEEKRVAKSYGQVPKVVVFGLVILACIALGVLCGRAIFSNLDTVPTSVDKPSAGKPAETITPLSMIRGEAHAWYLTRALNEPGKDVAFALYVFGNEGACEIVDAIDYGGERVGSYLNVGTFGAIDAYSDEELVANLRRFQESSDSAKGYCTSGRVCVDINKDKVENVVRSEAIWLEDASGEKLGDFEITGTSNKVFEVGSSYYAGFKCTHGQYLVRRFDTREEALAAVFELDTPESTTSAFTGKPDCPALSGSSSREIEIMSNGTTVDRIRDAAKQEVESREEAAAQDSVVSEEPEAVEAESYEQERACIASLDGWWAQFGGRSGQTASTYRNVLYIQDGTLYAYDGDGNLMGEATIDPSNVERHDGGIGRITEPGWYLYDLGGYVEDSDQNTIICINVDGSGYSGTGSYGRIDGEPDW